MSNIPSNYTFEEVLTFYGKEFSDDVLSKAIAYIDSKIALEKEVEQQRKYIERLEEQVYFRNEWIEEVVKEAESATKVKELKNFIKVSLENSYIELMIG